MLSDKEQAIITNKLQIPVLITEILAGESDLDKEVRFGIHELLSDMQPDAALLCIALSAKRISSVYNHLSPGMKVMDMECDKIVEDYAALWLENAQGKSIDECKIIDALCHVPEDLESLAELLNLNMSFLSMKDKNAAELCSILNVQAMSHALIAETFLETIDESFEKEELEISSAATAPVVYQDNVIAFPGTR